MRLVGEVPDMRKEGFMLFFFKNLCNRGLNNFEKRVIKVLSDPIKKS